MKKLFFLFILFLVVVAAAIVFFLFPLFKSAKHIANQKMVFNIISKTKSHVEIALTPPLFAGKAAIVPFNTLVKVGGASVDIDLSDRSIVKFGPESQFKIVRKSKKGFIINLLKGSLIFKRSENPKFKGIKSGENKIVLKGTIGMVSDTGVKILSGNAIVNGSINLGSGDAFDGKRKIKINPKTTTKIESILQDMGPSDQKNTWENFKTHMPNMYDEITIDQSTLDKLKTPAPGKKNNNKPTKEKDKVSRITEFLENLFKKKIDAYNEMYMLRLAVTTERYFRSDMSIPPDLNNLPMVDEEMKVDPWGTNYLYTLGGEAGFNIRSAGPDQNMNTLDDMVLFSPAKTNTLWQL